MSNIVKFLRNNWLREARSMFWLESSASAFVYMSFCLTITVTGLCWLSWMESTYLVPTKLEGHKCKPWGFCISLLFQNNSRFVGLLRNYGQTSFKTDFHEIGILQISCLNERRKVFVSTWAFSILSVCVCLFHNMATHLYRLS